MFGVRGFVERFHPFERNRVPLDFKVLGLAFYIQVSSLRRTARAHLSVGGFRRQLFGGGVQKLKARLRFSVGVKPRSFIAVDETCVKVNGQHYWVYSALDIDRNELISMRVYPARNSFTSESFLKGVLKHRRGRPRFIVDRAPRLRQALIQLGLNHHHQTFGRRSLAESAFSSLKQRTRTLFNKITVNLRRNQHLRWRRAVECWDLFYDMLTYYLSLIHI